MRFVKRGMAAFLAAQILGPLANAHSMDEDDPVARHFHAERDHVSRVAHLATGSAKRLGTTRHPWPFELLSIGHTIASFQHYGGTPYFHHGLDIRGDAGTDVLASVGGRVVNIENYMPGDPAYWEVAILDAEGYLWQYHHIDRNSIPQAIWDAYRRGHEIEAGTKLGEIYYWRTTAFGERFHHIHLNILGEGGAYLNPFAFLEPLPDDDPPRVVEVGILKNGRRWSGRSVNGNYTIFARIHDLILHDRFVVPPYSVSYRFPGEEPVEVWRFDRLPGGSSNTRYATSFFARNLTCGNYNCRELTIDLGFSPDGTRWFPQTRGTHAIEIIARDFVGNEVTSTFSWDVQ